MLVEKGRISTSDEPALLVPGPTPSNVVCFLSDSARASTRTVERQLWSKDGYNSFRGAMGRSLADLGDGKEVVGDKAE